jgi:diaminopimelate decarboxylase
MPIIHSGEVIALMDTGAYFTALESSFGFARPAIVSVRDGVSRLIRVRESFDDFVARDRFAAEVSEKEEAS